MAAILLTSILLLSHSSLAATIPSTKRTNGFCKQFDVPVSATAPGAIYDLPKVDNDLEATAWAIKGDTRTTPAGPALIVKDTTLSGTYKIHVQLCIPKSPKKNILQIASHGVHYDSRYWDPELQRDKQSYVEASMKQGYSILTYDRLGVGQSDIPDAYSGVQALLEVEILRGLTLMARDGRLYSLAEKARPAEAAFKNLAKPSKVVHVGHSFGSVLTTGFIATYPAISDGAIITGFILNKYLAAGGMSSWAVDFAGKPPYKRPSGYVVCRKSGIQTIFFAGDLKTAYTKEMLDYGDSIKQPVPIGELVSAYPVLAVDGSVFKKPVQYFLPEFDFYICDGDCKGIYEMEDTPKLFPQAEVVIHPNTGHAMTLHNNATAGYQLTFDFLARNGL